MDIERGCLSLSLFNKENSDAKLRLDSLEHRVSALEAANATHAGPPVILPGPSAQAPVVPQSLAPKTGF